LYWQCKKEAPSAQSAHAAAVSDTDTFDVLKAVVFACFPVDATAHPCDISQTALSLCSPAKIILTPYIPSKYRTTDLG